MALDTEHKKKSFTLTTLLLSALLLLLFYIGLTYMDPPEEKGISINFGTTDFGSGNVQPKEKIRSEPVNTPPKPVQQQEEVEEVQEAAPQEVAEAKTPEKVLTQESEESIRIKQQKEAKRKAEAVAERKKAEAERVAREKREAAERVQRQKDAKKKELDELMGGLNKSDGNATGSEGDDNRPGDKGSPDGDPYATSYYGGPGSGNGGSGAGLGGRSVVSRGKVPQDCNQEGRVVVKIVVDRNGRVLSATPGVKGTTNNHPCLLEPAKKTAMKYKWNLDSKAPAKQIGWIEVNFKLGG